MKILHMLVLLMIILISLSSCSNKDRYEFRIINDSDYKIDYLIIGIDSTMSPAATPKTFSDRFFVSQKRNWAVETFFSSAYMPITAVSYSDSGSVYTESLGRLIEVKKLKQNKVNELYIDIDRTTGETIFTVNINENWLKEN